MAVDEVVRVESLVKDYDGVRALKGITFSVKRGTVFAFLGPNGAGKTTTVEILECLRPPTDGQAFVLGYDVRRSSDQKEIRKRVGVLPQNFNALDKLTAKENIEYFGNMFDHSQSSTELLRLVAMEDRANVLFKNLSGGLKQRLALAVSLVNDPELVFLDEPTAGLDPRARRDVWQIIMNLKSAGKTVFLTTHYMDEAERLADRVAIIDAGSIVAEGSPEELIAEHGGARTAIFPGVHKDFADRLALDIPEASMTEDGSFEVPLTGKVDFVSLILAMKQGQVRTDTVEIRKPTLDEVFLNLTGRVVTEEGEAVRRG